MQVEKRKTRKKRKQTGGVSERRWRRREEWKSEWR